jgi:SNF2 family DNA or RNA helicase
VKTYGTVRLEDGEWKVRAEPHVVVRLKRVFGKVGRGAHGTIALSDTDENARDLLWFLDRYPMEVDDRKALERRAMRDRARCHAIEEVLEHDYEPPSFELAVPARRYQRVAAELLLRAGGLLLADDVGLGKTASAICTFTDRRVLPVLVVTLTHLPTQWQTEVAKFAPALRVHVVKKAAPYDLGAPFPDVVVLNYHKLSGWADVLAPRVKCVVFDEAQELRHTSSAKYAAATHVASQASFRLGLSATPIYNYGGEIFAVLDVLRPGALGTHEEFAREWCAMGDGGDGARIADPKAFGTHARATGLMLRRTRSDVGRELPAVTRVPHHVEADEGALDRVGASAAELARIILRQGEDHRGARFHASEELSSILRQATGIAKAPYVADFVRLLVESGERVVLFGWHREVYGIWLDRLRDLNPALYTGTESPARKEDARRRFAAGETNVLIMSLRSGAGVDGLQHASRTVVFGELDWSPGVHEQCVGRVHRDGQPDPVVAYFLVAERGADPVIADVLGLKKAQIDGLRDPHGSLVERLDGGGHQVRKLAASYLAQRGLLSDEEEAAATG